MRLSVRRGLDEALTQIASMGSLIAALNNTLLAQQTPQPTACAHKVHTMTMLLQRTGSRTE